MDRKGNMLRATSAGYRLPDRPNGPLASQSSVSVFKHSAGRTRNTGEKPAQDDDTRDPVKQDQVWREFVLAERTGVKEWKKNWSFLRNFDQLVRNPFISDDNLPMTQNSELLLISFLAVLLKCN
uniref:Uncharacterized protein n=1 Tax=Sinocyclocheilus grahami TaxID=75366 RepID=A0A672Q1X0_SINGR